MQTRARIPYYQSDSVHTDAQLDQIAKTRQIWNSKSFVKLTDPRTSLEMDGTLDFESYSLGARIWA
jgi:hypothetical protein